MTSACAYMLILLRQCRDLRAALLPMHLVFIAACNNHCYGETPFEKAMGYANQVAELNRGFESTYSQTEDVFRHATLLTRQLRKTGVENNQIAAFGAQQQIVVALQDLNRAIENNSWVVHTNASLSRSRDTADQLAAASRLQLHQLQAAKQLTEKRAQVLTVELQALSKELRELTQKANRFFPNYLRLADVYGMRTRMDWKAALRIVAMPSESNIGARYFRAVTLRRLGMFEDAEAEFKQLAALPTPMKLLFQAARAEALVLAGKTREGKRLIGTIQSEARRQAGVNGYKGLIAALEEDWQGAISAWKIDLENSKHEAALRRNIALGLTFLSKRNPRNAERALEQIRLADDVGGKNEWSIRLATAFVHSGLDDERKAIELAKQATEMTSAYCLIFCEQSAREIAQGNTPVWNFIEH
ncbi:MAG: hypothetical protein Aurels2KO_11040 [Aureliella sp.]